MSEKKELKREKYVYLMETVAEDGYDLTKFIEFVKTKHNRKHQSEASLTCLYCRSYRED